MGKSILNALTNGPWLYVMIFFFAALIMTVYETVKELIFKGMLTPWQSHTITIVVTAFLATFSAISIRSWSDKLLRKQQQLQLQQQKIVTLKLILKAVHHIVNNFLNYFQLLKLDMRKHGAVRDETIERLNCGIKEVAEQLRILEELEAPEKEESYAEIYPH